MPEEKQVDVEKKGAAKAVATEAVATEAVALEDVHLLGVRLSVPVWEVAGMMMAAGWAEGKQVSEAQFAEALNAFRKRAQGGGNIQL